MQTVPPDAHQFIFQQGIVRSQSVFLFFSPSHGRIATARSSGANLATLWLDLATFQTPSVEAATSPPRSPSSLWQRGGLQASGATL